MTLTKTISCDLDLHFLTIAGSKNHSSGILGLDDGYCTALSDDSQFDYEMLLPRSLTDTVSPEWLK